MMTNARTRQPGRGKRAAPPPPKSRNAQLNQQKRRVLVQHYRAKYGVK